MTVIFINPFLVEASEPSQETLTSGRAILFTNGGIEYFAIETLGNSSNFGNQSVARYGHSAFGSATRGVCTGGYTSGFGVRNTIDYVTVASLGNATYFGALATGRYIPGALSNNLRGVTYGGDTSGGSTATANMEYVTIATTGNGTSFGNLTSSRFSLGQGGGSSTRGLMPGGWNSNYTASLTAIDYITYASLANSTNFGSLTVAGRALGTCSSPTRAVFGSRTNHVTAVTTLDYVTISTLGNATTFGSTADVRWSASTHVRGTYSSSTTSYITIATLGNAANFGTPITNPKSACSNAHGGI